MHPKVESLKRELEQKYNVELMHYIGDEKRGVFKDMYDKPVHYSLSTLSMSFNNIVTNIDRIQEYEVNVLFIKHYNQSSEYTC